MKIDKTNQLIIVQKYINGESAPKLASDYNVHFNSIYTILNKYDIPRRLPTENTRKYKIKSNFLDIIDTEAKAYFLGLFYADGCLLKHRMVINLITEDDKILSDLSGYIFEDDKPLIKIKGEIRTIMSNPIPSYCKPMSRLDIGCVKMANRLREFGLTERKTDTIRLPNGIIPDHLFHHFVRGYFDGDGCVKHQRWSIVSNPDFILDMKIKLMAILELSLYIQKPKHCSKIHTLECYSFTAMEKMFDYMYSDSTIFLKRKYTKYVDSLKLMSEGPQRRIDKMAEIGKLRGKKIIQTNMDDGTVKIWDSNHACRRDGFDRNAITKCCKGEKEIYRNSKWEYFIPV